MTSAIKLIPKEILSNFEQKIIKFSQSITTGTKPGSVKYLLYGHETSRQSISIKMGKIIGEELPKLLISNSELQLQECGILKLQNCNIKKDFDLIWVDEVNKVVYYRESKGNMELDTEKLPATIDKVIQLEKELVEKYPDYTVNAGILNWSIYEREDADGGLTQIKKCEEKKVKIDHFKDFLQLLNFYWPKDEFTSYFRKLGGIIG